MKFKALAIAGLMLAATAGQVQAGFTFSNVSYTSNSLTFTIDGDMTGYNARTTYESSFSIRYSANALAGVTRSTQNSWSTSVFNNETFSNVGYTGGFPLNTPPDYTWSVYNSSLSDAVATNRTVTLTYGDDYLDTTATNAEIEFYWGAGASATSPTLLGSVTVGSVPEPASLAMWGLGEIGMMFAHRKRQQKKLAA